MTKPIAIYYEHPDWFRALFAELDRRRRPYIRLDASNYQYDPSASTVDFGLLFNRMSASAYLRGHANAIFYTANYLAHLEDLGVRVINGRKAFLIETSKALQLSLLSKLGLPFPETRVINSVSEAPSAARGLRFPVVIKPNIGGRGAGIIRYDSPAALDNATNNGGVDLGIDQTALVQEYLPARGGHITRIETLAGKFLYAIKVYPTADSFNLCPAEFCQTDNTAESLGEFCLADAPRSGLRVEPCTPPSEMIEAVERIARAGEIDCGGVEYIIDDRDGSVHFYDINALSNFVADAPSILGFDPHARLVDFLEEEASR